MADIIGNYKFSPHERRAYNQLSTADEKWAYLVFARERHGVNGVRRPTKQKKSRSYLGFEIMKAWRELPEGEREQRIHDAQRDRTRPDAAPVSVRYSVEPDSPGSINEWDGRAGQRAKGDLEWRFAKTLYKRNYRAEDEMSVALRLWVGVDAENRVQDRIVIKTVDYAQPPGFAPGDPWDEYVRAEVDELCDKYLQLGELPNSPYILKPRHWGESSCYYRVRDQNMNVLFDEDGEEEKVWRTGIRSYTDYCEIGDLGNIIWVYSWEWPHANDSKKIPEQFIFQVFHEMAQALKVLAGDEAETEESDEVEGLIHRDIKPQNIFLKPGATRSDYPRMLLADFDLAAPVSDTDTAGVVGTIGYISPETLRDDYGNVSAKSDIWSLSAVIWDLMHSFRGFPSRDQAAPGLIDLRQRLHERIGNQIWDHVYFDAEYSTHQHINERLDPIRDLPEYTTWLSSFVNWCSKHHPDWRPNATELVNELDVHLQNVALVKNGQRMPHDILRYKKDPFYPGRILDIQRQRVQHG